MIRSPEWRRAKTKQPKIAKRRKEMLSKHVRSIEVKTADTGREKNLIGIFFFWGGEEEVKTKKPRKRKTYSFKEAFFLFFLLDVRWKKPRVIILTVFGR